MQLTLAKDEEQASVRARSGNRSGVVAGVRDAPRDARDGLRATSSRLVVAKAGRFDAYVVKDCVHFEAGRALQVVREGPEAGVDFLLDAPSFGAMARISVTLVWLALRRRQQ
jgi:hypothetical protein